MTKFESATCSIDHDPTDILSQRYITEENESTLDLNDIDNQNSVIGGQGKIKVNVETGKVWVYATNGSLVKSAQLTKDNCEVLLSTGIYFVVVESEGNSHTEKVFVHP